MKPGPGGRRPARLRPHERLASPAEYQRVLRRGLRLDGPLFCLMACENGREYDRLGLAASRRLGGAVRRNRAKRLLRECFRRNKREGEEGADLVLLPKREITSQPQGEVEREYRERLRRLAARRPARARSKDRAPVD